MPPPPPQSKSHSYTYDGGRVSELLIIAGTLFPTKTVGIPGDKFAFICTDGSHTALSVQWLVNGTLLENSRLLNVFQEFNNKSKTADLSFDLPLEHNVTTIQCIVNFASENVSSETFTLLLQGQLSARTRIIIIPNCIY